MSEDATCPQTLTTSQTAQALLEYLGDLLYTPDKARLDVDALSEDFQDVGRGLLVFQETLAELRAFAADLGKGNLTVEPPARNELAAPLKSLHANLLHLTWQARQVAIGDYGQKVDFLGEFADAFNVMIRQLDERRKSVQNEMEENRRKTLALEQSVGLFTTLTELSPQWILVLERTTKEILFANQAAKDMLAVDGAMTARLLGWLEDNAGLGDAPQTTTAEIATARKTWYLSVTLQPFVWPPHQAISCIISDKSAEYEQLQALETVAYSDPMTGVGNRHFGMKTLSDWISAREHFCVSFVDMDSLKYVNDTFGHPAGDEYIAAVAKLLSEFSPDVSVSRLGGDEFMLLQRGWSEARATERLAELRAELGRQATGPDQPYTRSVSYGVVEALPGNTLPGSDLLSMADEKMYVFKRFHKKQRQNTVVQKRKTVPPQKLKTVEMQKLKTVEMQKLKTAEMKKLQQSGG